MDNKLTVSLSPHTYGNDSVNKIMYGVIIALIPALLVSVYYFGIGAILITAVSVASCVLFEYILQKFLMKTKPTIGDGSAIITGLLLAFNVPSNLPIWILIIGAIVAIGIGKMSFGGLGQNPFNPALVGRVFLLISFPAQMTVWPVPEAMTFTFADAHTGATALSVLQSQSAAAVTEQFSNLSMFLGNMGGSLGEISAIALLIGAVFMLFKKIISWHIPVAVLASMALFSGILWLIDDSQFVSPLFHVLSGGALLGALFMATDMATSPMTKKGMIIFGIGIGVITMIIRIWGAYPEGMSFAILIMNAFVPLLNKYIKPKRFGRENS